MPADVAAAFASLFALLVTIAGWFFTARSQERLATVQGEIQKTVSEHDTRFAYLHKRRGEVIDQVYAQIDNLDRILQDATMISDNDKERRDKNLESTNNALLDFRSYYSRNRLYLDKKLRQEIEKLLIASMMATGSRAAQVQTSDHIANWQPFTDQTVNAQLFQSEKANANNIVMNIIPAIRNLIEEQMQQILDPNKPNH